MDDHINKFDCIDEFANSIDADEEVLNEPTPNEPPHLDLSCLPLGL